MREFTKQTSPRTSRTSQVGSTLIELLIATAVVVIILTGVAISMMYTIKTQAASRYRAAAVGLAQGSMDLFYAQRAELGWDDFHTQFPASSEWCVTTDVDDNDSIVPKSGVCPEYSIGGIGFQREIERTDDGSLSDKLSAQVRVIWNPGSSATTELTYTIDQDFYKGAN